MQNYGNENNKMTGAGTFIPTKLCKINGVRLTFFCEECNVFHSHGLASQKPGRQHKSHRVAHCTSPSGREKYKKGYYIYFLLKE